MDVSWRIDYRNCIGVLFGVIRKWPGPKTGMTLYSNGSHFGNVSGAIATPPPNHFLIRFANWFSSWDLRFVFHSFKKKFFFGPPPELPKYQVRGINPS